MIRSILLLLMLTSLNVVAKTRVKIEKFENKAADGRCHTATAWKSDLGAELQRQFTMRLNNDHRLSVINGDGEKTEYRLTGSLRAFDQCPTLKQNGSAYVAIEVRVYDAKTGSLAFSYSNNVNVSGRLSASGTADFNAQQFKASALGQAAQSSIYDLAYRVEQNLLTRKSMVHIVSKNARKVASVDYKIKLVKKER
jgi:hypothetical protein